MNDPEKQRAEWRAKASAAFPFERIEVRGADAFAAWQKLKAEGHGVPVIIGDDTTLDRMMEPFDPSDTYPSRPVTEVLAAAAGLKMPDDLFGRRRNEDLETAKAAAELMSKPDAELPTVIETRDANGNITGHMVQWGAAPGHQITPPDKHSRLLSPEETRKYLTSAQLEPDQGAWPDEPPAPTGLTLATDILTGKPLDKVWIVMLPTKDWTEAPAYLRWGNWNDCPPPEYHVAAFRYWRDRYGVELIGIGADTLNLRAAKRPRTREEAIALAREQYAYCTDIVEQGTETISVLAAGLMASDWWFFWWD